MSERIVHSRHLVEVLAERTGMDVSQVVSWQSESSGDTETVRWECVRVFPKGFMGEVWAEAERRDREDQS